MKERRPRTGSLYTVESRRARVTSTLIVVQQTRHGVDAPPPAVVGRVAPEPGAVFEGGRKAPAPMYQWRSPTPDACQCRCWRRRGLAVLGMVAFLPGITVGMLSVAPAESAVAVVPA